MDESSIRDAIVKLNEVEKELAEIDRIGLRKRLEEVTEAVEALLRFQIELRSLRVRLQSLLPAAHDPDKTPVEPFLTRRSSTTLPRIDPTKYEKNDK